MRFDAGRKISENSMSGIEAQRERAMLPNETFAVDAVMISLLTPHSAMTFEWVILSIFPIFITNPTIFDKPEAH